MGDRLRKDFDTIYDGMIIDIWYDKSAISYTVIYEDGDCEDLSKEDVVPLLLAIPYWDSDSASQPVLANADSARSASIVK